IVKRRKETMKRITLMITILAATLYLGDLTVMAQRGHGGGAGGQGGPSSHGKMDNPASDKGMKPAKNHDTGGVSHDRNVGDRLAHNQALSSKLQALLPAGTNLQEAYHGFKNLDQFVAAVNVSNYLKITYDQLK